MSDSKESDTTQVAAGSASAAQHTDGMTAQVTTGDKSDSDYLANQVTAPRSPYELQAGTKIPAVISESVDSDMPGYVNAIVSEDVYDSIRGVYLLIPKGSRLLGQYVSLSGPGQTRTAVAFTRLFFPGTGNYLDLGGMSGADQQGNMGLGGDVDTHNGRLVMTALKLAILQVGTSIGAGQNTSILQAETPAQTAAQAVNTAVGQVGQKILNQDVLPPTLHVRIGTRFNVRVEHDIVFPGPTH
jgi:type IV secretion system protein VirB10